MDINDLKRKIKAQRLINTKVDDVAIELIIPSDFDAQICGVKAGLGDGKPEAMLLFKRSLLELSITGWTGLTVGYLTGQNDSDSVDFDKQLIVDFLNANQKNADILAETLLSKIFEKRELANDAKKN